ncbi:MAG: aminotransferase class V-fold PLP-dependent enzyme [Actinomycetaceae bacterium]
MTSPSASAAPNLLDLPPLTPGEVTGLEERIAEVLGVPTASHDVALVPGEAILALEAAARSVAHPGQTAVNVVTGPYGALFGSWMRATGAEVVDVTSPLDSVADPAEVRRALDDHPDATVLAVVHAEAATGGTNDLDAILALAEERGLITVVDAVASVGAEPVPFDRADVVAIGPQKGLAGPAGISALTVSRRAWAHIGSNPAAPRDSSLSLLDWHERWLRSDRTEIPGYLPWLEAHAFAAAIDRVGAEGLDAVEARHAAARAAARAGIAELGLEPWQREESAAAPIVTTVRLPESIAGRPTVGESAAGAPTVGESAAGAPTDGGSVADGVDATEPTDGEPTDGAPTSGESSVRGLIAKAAAASSGIVGPGPGPLTDRLLRIVHTGRAASLDAVRRALTALAPLAPNADGLEAALAAAEAAWSGR